MRGMFYGWKLAGLSLLVIGLASGPVWSGVGVWVKALEMQFGWSRAQLTGAFSLAQLEGSIFGPLLGYLIDRLGPRRMVFIGLVITRSAEHTSELQSRRNLVCRLLLENKPR